MAQFPALELTTKGQDMLIRASSGKTEDRLIITKAKLGDGMLTHGIESLVDIVSTKLVVPLSDIKVNNNQATVTFVYDNKTLEKGFYHREVGVFAKNGDDGIEYLLTYSNAGNYTSYIPSKDTPIPSQIMNVVFGVENAENVELKILDGGIVTPKQFDEFKLEVKGLIENHNSDENAHSNLFTKIQALINTAMKALNNYLPLTGGTVTGKVIVDKLESKGNISTNASVYANTDNIAVSQNDNLVPTTAWVNKETVKSFDGQKGVINFNSMLYKINNETDMNGKTMEQYYQDKGWVKNYYNADSCKKNNLPYIDSTILHIPAYKVDHSYMDFLFSREGLAYREWYHGVAHENANWSKILTDSTIDEAIVIKNYDLRNKTSGELAKLGFRKLRGGENASNLGYPTNWCLVLNIPAIAPDYIDVHQLAFGNDGELYVRNVFNNASTNDTPWVKLASKNYVDTALGNATSIEILDFE